VPVEGRETEGADSISLGESDLRSHSTVLGDWGREVLEDSGGEMGWVTIVDIEKGPLWGGTGEGGLVTLAGEVDGSECVGT